ncbi:MAG: hypothetical protein LBQ73_09035 [Tannerellaceae bacterium]|nr:hypothetical protein [Tannerellaceae bacterium]
MLCSEKSEYFDFSERFCSFAENKSNEKKSKRISPGVEKQFRKNAFNHQWGSPSRQNIHCGAIWQIDDAVIPIEVKKGKRNRSKSLGVFVEKYKSPYSIRISKKNFGFENGIKSVPLYAAFCI